MERLVAQKQEVMGLPIDSLLTDLGWTSVEEYLAGMEPPIESRRQWGGFVEAAIMGHVWQMQVAFFLELQGGGRRDDDRAGWHRHERTIAHPNSPGLVLGVSDSSV